MPSRDPPLVAVLGEGLGLLWVLELSKPIGARHLDLDTKDAEPIGRPAAEHDGITHPSGRKSHPVPDFLKDDVARRCTELSLLGIATTERVAHLARCHELWGKRLFRHR